MFGMTDRPTDPTDRPELRPAAPVGASVGTPNSADHRPTSNTSTGRLAAWWKRGRPVAATQAKPTRPAVGVRSEPARPTATNPVGSAQQPTRKAPGRFRQWRTRRAETANGHKAPAVTADQAAAVLATYRPTGKPSRVVESPDDIAPMPRWMKVLGVWIDRTFGAIPLAAPLIVSGDYTMQVFTAAPINAHPLVALAATCALEGGVWKLSRLYEKTLVAGDSTIALRAGIGVYLALISGLIYWHAGATTSGNRLTAESTLPAVGVAVMSALGVYIWSRTARWARRRELHAMGRVDTQAPKFAAMAWVLCPVETPQALRHAVKYRIPSPVQAVESLRLFKASGRPAVWPPVADRPMSVGEPTIQPRTVATRPTVAPTVAPTAPRPRVADQSPRPAHAAPTGPTVPARPAVVPNADRSAHTPAAVRNAADLRRRYGTRTDLKLGTIRSDTGWSFDRADPAFKAYLAGADRSVDDESEPAYATA
jgi:hypothetical protein